MKFSSPSAWRRLSLLGVAGSSLVLAFACWTPVHSKLNCLLFLAAIGILWASILVLLRKRARLRWPERIWMALPILAALPLLLPARAPNREALRGRSLAAIATYAGSPYRWGGEARNGIDCSGLPRKAYRRALRAEGLRTLNGGLLRRATEHWFFDASALALSQGYRDFTVELAIPAATIKAVDFTRLLPGDLAITTSGVHALVYVGEGQWTQADPGEGQVHTLVGREEENHYFHVPCRFFRWSELAE